MLKKFLPVVMLVLVSFACSLSPGVKEEQTDKRPVVSASQPTIVLLAPQTGSRFVMGAEILLHAEARDLGAGITRIEFVDDFGNVLGTVNSQNPEGDAEITAIVKWTPQTAQRHFITAIASRKDGTESNHAEITIEIVQTAAPTETRPPAVIPTFTPTVESTESTAPAIEVTEPVLEVSLKATVINTNSLNVRAAPSINASPLASLAGGTEIEIVGRSADNLWYATPRPEGGYGWVFGQYLQIEGDPATLPLVTTEQ